MFISGFLGLVTAAGQGTATEYSGSGYARQPMSFGDPKFGVCFNSSPWTFGNASGVVGRAIWDAPVGGNLLLIMPFVSTTGRMARDFGDVGTMRIYLPSMAAYADGAAYNSVFQGSSIVGTCNDAVDVQGGYGALTTSGATGTVGGGLVSGQPGPVINTAVLSTGSGITIARGILQAIGTGQA